MTYGPLNGVMTAFIYDCRNRLIKAGNTIYEYDAENTRIAIQTKEKREEYVVDKNTIYSQVLSITTYEKNLLGQFAKEKDYTVYTYGIGLISQERTTTQTSETTGAKSVGTGEYYLYHYNQIGSTTQITDMEGKVIYTYTYSAYGERTGTYDADGNIIDDNSNPIRFLYNGQAGVETDENGLYYMRARYYNTDIKRFINRDIVDGTIQNSQSLNKYSYVQGNPISLTDPFGLCPEGGGILDYLKLAGHTLLDLAGFIPVVGFIPDLVNSYWYHCEKNPTMAMASFISAIPGIGDFAGAALKGVGWVAKCSKLVKAADVVKDTCRFTGAVAQTGLNIQNTKNAWDSVVSEYQSTGKVSFLNAGNLALSAFGVGMGAKLSTGYANKFAKKYGINGKRIWNYLRYDNRGMVDLSYFKKSGTDTTRVRHYTNSKGLKGIKESGTIIAQDNNRVYLEMANKKPLSSREAEEFYQIGRGKGKNYIEFDVDSSLLEWIENPRYHRMELTVKGSTEIKNAKFFKRDK